MKKLLLLSSSREGNTDYLSHAIPMINNHLGSIKSVLFIPYAGVNMTYDEYADKVQHALPHLTVTSIHQSQDVHMAIKQADAILVGGGNTFHLLHQLYKLDLIETIKRVVSQGTPYIGWSAGSNIAGMSIKTTNDMPIIEPKSFTALNLVPFQLNPHYTDYVAPGHNGETRDQRLSEFMVLEPNTSIVGIMEGSALSLSNSELLLRGNHPGYLFKGGEKHRLSTDADLSYLL